MNENLFLASRMKKLGTETAFEVLAKAKSLEIQGKSIIHFEIGEPDFDTPKHIVDAGVKALKSGATHYTQSAGILEFRDVIRKHILKTRNVEIETEQIIVTPGAKPIIFYTILACVNEGDEVIYPNPGFPIYESLINFVGAIPVSLPLYEGKNFRFEEKELERLITPKTKLIILNSPHNPTGGILTCFELESVARLAVKHNLLVLSDEVYDEILYDGRKHQSIISFPNMKERTILLAGHSKNYAMTGWRLGYGIFPKEIAFYVIKLMVNSNSCTAHFTQMAGIAALEETQEPTKKMVSEFQKRRDFMVENLNKMGLHCLCPEGAFYVFPSVYGVGMSSKKLSEYFLEKAGVAVLDGSCFGSQGSGYIRLSYTNSMKNIREGLIRMSYSLKELKRFCRKSDPLLSLCPTSASNDWVIHNRNGTKRIIVTKEMPGKRWLHILLEEGFRVEVGTSSEILSIEEIKRAIGNRCDGVIGQLTEKWNEELFRSLKNAGGKAYSNMAVGYDNVEIFSATKYGILVGNTPGVLTETTSEMAIALTFSVARRIVEADKFMREGHYKGWLPNLFVGTVLHNKTLGIIGAGRIGATFAISMATGVKMNILYFDINENIQLESYFQSFNDFLVTRGEKKLNCKRVSTLEELLKESDVVSLHTNLDSSSFHLINESRLLLMKPDSILINTSRGAVIDEKALVLHCQKNPKFRVGLDVYENEPKITPGLEKLPNVIILPHIASSTEWTRSGMAVLAALNIRGILKEFPLWKGANMLPFLKEGYEPNAIPSLVNYQEIQSKL